MIFYGDSFKKDGNWIYGGVTSTIKMEYNQEYDKQVFNKIYNLFKDDKNVKIELLEIYCKKGK